MNDNHVIQSLWIGPTLSPMERLGINSFLRHGHEFHLYTYTSVGNVPQGTIIKNAKEIIPPSLVDYTKFSRPAIFADLFRYKLLLERGGWWVDTDTVCLRPFDFSEEYVFSSEVMSANKGVTTLGTQTNNGNIKAPAESSIMKHLWAECKGRVENPNSVRWSTTGPLMIAPAVEKFSLKGYVRPPHDLCPVMAWDVAKFVQTTPLEIPSTAYAVHLWNEIWRWENLDKNGSFPPGCAYEQLKRRFMDRGTPGIIQSLWVGGRLSNMEKLSIASYLHYGEKFHLYTYGPVEGVPEGVVIKDANEIVPQSDISKFQNMANFSDWFRYNLLFKKGNCATRPTKGTLSMAIAAAELGDCPNFRPTGDCPNSRPTKMGLCPSLSAASSFPTAAPRRPWSKASRSSPSPASARPSAFSPARSRSSRSPSPGSTNCFARFRPTTSISPTFAVRRWPSGH